MAKTKLNDWFENKLHVGRFPTPFEIEKSDYQYIINVSDELIVGCMDVALRSGKKYFWFPMNECTKDIGVNSIYAACQILRLAEEQNAKVYLHCHAGVNRSQTVAECYYRMRSGRTWPKTRGRLEENIRCGHLPCESSMYQLLTEWNKAFDLDETYRGGQLDLSKITAKV